MVDEKDDQIFTNILTNTYKNKKLQNQYEREIIQIRKQNSTLMIIFIQIILLPMLCYNTFILQNYRFALYISIIWFIQLIFHIISRYNIKWIEYILFIQIIICEISYIYGQQSKMKTQIDNFHYYRDISNLNGMTIGITILVNQYVQTHSILKIFNNIIVIILIFIFNSAPIYIRICLLLALIFTTLAVHFKDKHMKRQFFNLFKKSQNLKGWQNFISKELPQSVFIVTKQENIQNGNKNNIIEQEDIFRHKNSTAFTGTGAVGLGGRGRGRGSTINKSYLQKGSILTKKNTQDEISKTRNVSSYIQSQTQTQDEPSQLSYDIVFMNKKCKSFLLPKNVFGKTDTKGYNDNNSNNKINSNDNNSNNIPDIERQKNHMNFNMNKNSFVELKQILQKLFISRNIDQNLPTQTQFQKDIGQQCSSYKKVSKKRLGQFLGVEKEKISIHKLIQQCLNNIRCNILSEKCLNSVSNTNERLISMQNEEVIVEMTGQTNKDSNHNLFAPRMIEHHVNCHHFTHNTFFDLKIFECYYNDKSSLMVILDDISKKVLEERQRDVETYKEKLLSMITHNLKTPLNGIQCILDLFHKSKLQKDKGKFFFQKQLKQKIIRIQHNQQNKIESIDLEETYIRADSIAINIALQNTRLLSFMINDLIDQSCIMKDELVLNAKYYKIEDCIQIIHPIFKEQLTYKQIELIIEISHTIEHMLIYNDQQRFLQILVNLMTNSLKYTFKGNIKLIIEDKIDYNTILITITDTGIGMRESTIKKLCSTQDDIYSSQNYSKGMGLGFSLIQNLVQKIGPEQTLQIQASNQDGGTTISFEIYKDISLKKSLNSCQLVSVPQKMPTKQTLKLDIQKSYELLQTGNELNINEQREEVRHISTNDKKKIQFKIIPNSISEFHQDVFLHNHPKELLCSLLKNKRIMIVDDTVFNILALKVLLKNIPNLQIQEACNGEIAVNLFKQSIELSQIKFNDKQQDYIPEIIFMDINMPVMDGVEATKQITYYAQTYSINVKIITVSAFSQEHDKENFFFAGSHFHVAKPIKIESLIEALQYISPS